MYKLCLITLCTAATLVAQGPPPGPDMTIDAAVRNEVIANALKALNQAYVFPDIATKMEQAIRDHQKRNEYDNLTSARKFGETLTEHLRAVSQDKHLRVDYVSQTLPPQPAPGSQPPPDERARALEQQRAVGARFNFSFEKVERLAGNIGYLDLRAFEPVVFVGDTAAAAMNFLSNTQAVIVDLRQNGGGDPLTVSLIASYFFGPMPVHLNDLFFRPTGETTQYWTLPYLPGKRMPDKDLYVLTSQRTFSGAEEFTYDMKTQKRATIIGEVTGGGAHPGGGRRLHDHFIMFVPSGRPINPVTKSDWEGTGVEPDVKVPAERALATAHLMALEKFVMNMPDAPRLKAEAEAAISRLKKELSE